jgi:flagellar biosynthesis/type III secretory pathway M-ring protein FliF/YscJ
MTIAKYVMALVIVIMVILLLRSMAKTIAEAMNPPVPQVEIGAAEEEIPIEVPENLKRSNELLERVELMTQQEPVNIASIIREWLLEPGTGKKK